VALVKLDDGMDESNVNVVLTDSSVISVCGTTAEISKMRVTLYAPCSIFSLRTKMYYVNMTAVSTLVGILLIIS